MTITICHIITTKLQPFRTVKLLKHRSHFVIASDRWNTNTSHLLGNC